jgi:hypothetical protein
MKLEDAILIVRFGGCSQGEVGISRENWKTDDDEYPVYWLDFYGKGPLVTALIHEERGRERMPKHCDSVDTSWDSVLPEQLFDDEWLVIETNGALTKPDIYRTFREFEAASDWPAEYGGGVAERDPRK